MTTESNGSNSALNRVKRRRAVARALARYMTRDHLLEAVKIWMDQYDDADQPDVFEYITSVTDRFDDPGMQVDAIMRVHKQLAAIEAESGSRFQSITSPGPVAQGQPPQAVANRNTGNWSDASRRPAPPLAKPIGSSVPTAMPARRGPAASTAAPSRTRTTPSVEAHYVVFNRFIDVVIDRLEVRQPTLVSDVCRYIGKILSPELLGREQLQEIHRWVESEGRYKITGGLSPAQLSEFVHEIYIWCCEEVGPVDTDKMFGAATRAAEELPESGRFSPRQLL